MSELEKILNASKPEEPMVAGTGRVGKKSSGKKQSGEKTAAQKIADKPQSPQKTIEKEKKAAQTARRLASQVVLCSGSPEFQKLAGQSKTIAEKVNAQREKLNALVSEMEGVERRLGEVTSELLSAQSVAKSPLKQT